MSIRIRSQAVPAIAAVLTFSLMSAGLGPVAAQVPSPLSLVFQTPTLVATGDASADTTVTEADVPVSVLALDAHLFDSEDDPTITTFHAITIEFQTVTGAAVVPAGASGFSLTYEMIDPPDSGFVAAGFIDGAGTWQLSLIHI